MSHRQPPRKGRRNFEKAGHDCPRGDKVKQNYCCDQRPEMCESISRGHDSVSTEMSAQSLIEGPSPKTGLDNPVFKDALSASQTIVYDTQEYLQEILIFHDPLRKADALMF